MSLRPLDLKALFAATEKVVALKVGDVRIRRLSQIEHMQLMPPLPAGVMPVRTGKETEDQVKALNEDAVKREQAWLASLPPAESVARRAEMLDAMYAAISRASLEPRLTVEDAKRLGDDAFTLFRAIRQFWEDDAKAETNGSATVEEPATV